MTKSPSIASFAILVSADGFSVSIRKQILRDSSLYFDELFGADESQVRFQFSDIRHQEMKSLAKFVTSDNPSGCLGSWERSFCLLEVAAKVSFNRCKINCP